jgi:hypothetical protein
LSATDGDVNVVATEKQSVSEDIRSDPRIRSAISTSPSPSRSHDHVVDHVKVNDRS